MAKARTKPRARKPQEPHSAEQVMQTMLGVLPAGQPAAVPYSTSIATKAYASWVYAAATLRAQAVASVPLRLYTRSAKTLKAQGHVPFYVQRQVPKRRKRYLMGEMRHAPHHVAVRKAMEMDGDIEEVIGAPESELLRRVNPWQGGFELLTLTCLNLNLTGMAYWFCDRTGRGGVPSLIMSLMPRKVEIVPGVANLIDGYIFGRNEASPVSLTTDEVVYFRRPNPDNNWYGRGFVESAWAVISQNHAVHEMDTAFFRNYARPDYLATVQGTTAQEDQLKRFKASLAEQVGGKSKTGRMLAVTGQVDIKPLSFPPKDLSGRDEIVEEIAAIFGVPVTMLKANDPNLASATQGYQQYRENSIATDCRLIEDVLNQSYLPMWGIDGEAFFAFDSAILEDEDRESQIADRRVRAGVVTLNEVRGEIGYEPVSDPLADALLFNGQPIGQVPPSPVPTMPPRPRPEPEEDEEIGGGEDEPAEPEETVPEPKRMKSVAVEKTPMEECVARKIRILIAEGYPQDQAVAIAYSMCEEEKRRGCAGCGEPSGPDEPEEDKPDVASQKALALGDSHCDCGCHGKAVTPAFPEDEISRKMLAEFVASLDAVLRAQAGEIIYQLERANTPTSQMLADVQRILADQKWVERIAESARPFIGRSTETGGNVGLRMLPEPLREAISFDYANPEVQRYVDTATTRLAGGVNGTTQVRVADLLGRSLAEGKTIPEIAAGVRESLQVDGSRAEMIARTESARAYSQGQIESWKQAGPEVVKGKRWVLAPDACEFCRAVARQFNESNPVPVDQPFYRLGDVIAGVKGGTMAVDYMDIDGEPLHPGCRCTTAPVIA